MGYKFWCRHCKFDHEGECAKPDLAINPDAPPVKKSIIESIRELAKLLQDGGGYNARPTKLHQCRRDGKCGVAGCDPSVPDDSGAKFWVDATDIRVKGDTITASVWYRVPAISFIPITFQITDVK